MQFKDLMVTRYRIEREGEKPIRLTIDGAARTIADQEPNGRRARDLSWKVGMAGTDW